MRRKGLEMPLVLILTAVVLILVSMGVIGLTRCMVIEAENEELFVEAVGLRDVASCNHEGDLVCPRDSECFIKVLEEAYMLGMETGRMNERLEAANLNEYYDIVFGGEINATGYVDAYYDCVSKESCCISSGA